MTLLLKISRVPTLTAIFAVVMQFVSAKSKKMTLHFVYKFYVLARAAFDSFYENQI